MRYGDWKFLCCDCFSWFCQDFVGMFHCEMFSGRGVHVGVATKVLICTSQETCANYTQSYPIDH